MNAEAFIRLIIAKPDSLHHRMVYADWLEERGDPRGEFIRAQCVSASLNWIVEDWAGSLGRIEEGAKAGASLATAQQLERRAEVLLTDHGREWTSQALGVGLVTGRDFYRPNVTPCMTAVKCGPGDDDRLFFTWRRGF